ncbi:agamous-like MADS-box protein AGL30 isoform X2 [Andrographis paniculata]|uniref:agamous-like MADS-box protein AGL30 isoform X2 n=1 Tax=Andrographis paniculata TaxID=175694 RepID=UPI0021E83B23|nr:agamous-like MADS-box protein AGL30 isoform X2 [Andrographis paniculata]
MGRVKLKIQRLESLPNRQVTYGKRRNGILKKAQELSVLCDIHIFLLMFSPSGKPSVFCGENSNIADMIAKYAQLTPKERAKRRLESLETLKRNFKKVDQDVDIEEFLNASNPSIEEMRNQVSLLKGRITEVHKRISWWGNPDNINDMEHLNQMESSLQETLNRVRQQKQEKFPQNHQMLQFDCSIQTQNSMPFPVIPTGDQDCQTQSWLPGGVPQQMILPNESHFLGNRDIDCARDASFPSCSSFFGNLKPQDIDKGIPLKNDRQDEGISIDDYASSSYLRLPLNEQFACPSTYGSLTFPYMMDPGREAAFPPNPMDYHINGNFELPRSVYSSMQHHSLVPNPGSCAISIFNEDAYPQPPNQFNASL